MLLRWRQDRDSNGSGSDTDSRRPMPRRRKHRLPLRAELLEDRLVPAGDVVLDWNQTALAAIRQDNTVPPAAARDLAIMHVAIYDSVNAVDRTYTSYLVDTVAPAGASLTAAAAQAAHDTLVTLFPAQQARFDQALATSLQGVDAGPAKDAGVALGQFVAARTLTLRKNDGSAIVTPYTPGSGPGVWVPTPPGFLPAVLPGWGNVTPFALTSGSQFRPPAPPALTSADLTMAYNEVKALGGDGVHTPSNRTADQTQIAQFWADGAGTVTPPGHWSVIAHDVAVARGTTPVQNARLFALLNIALADAGIAAWDAKYVDNYWRPVTAIRNAHTAGNPSLVEDPNWTPLLVTPPFPSYFSGHSTFSAAGAAILASFFGSDNVSFIIGSDFLPGVTRSFTTFSAAASEAGQSRIYGGIHYQFDNQQGLTVGRSIADYTLRNLLKSRITPNQRLVTQVYQDVLQRPVDLVGLAAFSSALDQGTGRTQVVQTIVGSAEYRALVVQQTYTALLHRSADAMGLSTFTNFLAQGGTAEQLQALIAGSPEYFQTRGGGTNDGFLDALYHDALGRAVDATGRDTFRRALMNGATTGQVATAVVSSPEYQQDLVQSFYMKFLHRAADPTGLNAFVHALQGGVRDEQCIASLVGSDEYFGRL